MKKTNLNYRNLAAFGAIPVLTIVFGVSAFRSPNPALHANSKVNLSDSASTKDATTTNAAQERRELEGGTIEGKKLTLKAGFEFTDRTTKEVSVRKKQGNKAEPPPKAFTARCICSGTPDPNYECEQRQCGIEVSGTVANCQTNACCPACKWEVK